MLADSNPAKPRLLKAIPSMNQYLARHGAPPEKISNTGQPLPNDGGIGFSAALLPYLQSSANTAALTQQLDRIQAQLDQKTNLYGNPPAYYDQNLVLFGSGWTEKLFQFGTSGELLVRWSR